MNKILIILFSTILFSDDNDLLFIDIIDKLKSQGNKVEKIIEYHDDGEQIRYEGYLVNKVPTGLWRYYYEDGTILIEDYHNLRKSISYYNNGNIKSEIYQTPGTIGSYYGKHLYYYENGNVKEEQNWEDGKQYGDWKFYNENGVLNKLGYWTKGVGTDIYSILTMIYFNSKGEIKFIEYYNELEIYKVELFKDGKLIETKQHDTMFDENGKQTWE